MDVVHALEMSSQRASGRLHGRCRCGARVEGQSVAELQQALVEHGRGGVPSQRQGPPRE